MNSSQFSLRELEQLIEAVRDERIAPGQIARLEEMLREHTDARRYYGRAMRLHAYLEQNAAAVSAAEQAPEALETPLAKPAESRASTPRRTWVRWAGAFAACLVLAAWFFRPALWKGHDQQVERPDEEIDTPGPRVVAFSPRWEIEPAGTADYSIVDEAVVRLDRGELWVASVTDLPAPTVLVRTPAGDVSASGTQFLVGYHRAPVPPRREPRTDSLVRVFVLSGVVTVANVHGSVTGGGNELLLADKQSAPAKQAVRANSDFAIDLYRQLADQHNGENMVFSPYSVSIALAMTAEGARGETAQEIGQVLRWPHAIKRVGNDAQSIPWETSAVHSGLASLARMLAVQQDTPERQAIRRQIASLQKELKTLQERNAQLLHQMDAHRAGVQEEVQLAARLNELIGQVDQYELCIANGLWGERTYPFDPNFVKTVTGAYDAGDVQMVDFRGAFQQQRSLVNGWAEDETRERIKGLVPQGSLGAATRMVLANAIYFHGDWKSPFDESETEERDFTLADGGTAKTPLMRKRSMASARYGAFTAEGTLLDIPRMIDPSKAQPAPYPDETGFAIVELPYRGNELAMVVIAPARPDGLDELERRLDSEILSRWIDQLHQRKVHVYLPKFKAEASYSLAETLATMGMGTAFDPGRADFSGMTATGGRELFLSGVFHKIIVDVNEGGTEAVATAAVKEELPAPIPRPKPFTPVFRADRPFLYLIVDRPSGSVLLLGRMVQP